MHYPSDYYGSLGSNVNRRDHYGAASGYGGYDCEDKVSLALLLTVAAGIGLMGYVLYTKVLANGGRKKREDTISEGIFPLISTSLVTNILTGKFHSKFIV